MTEPSKSKEISGWLWIWSHRVRKYEKMWFVLSDGVLTYYTTQEELTESCQGGISLVRATIDFDETCKFVICQDEEVYHVKADNPRVKQQWIEALLTARDDASDADQYSLGITDACAKDHSSADEKVSPKPVHPKTENYHQNQGKNLQPAEVSTTIDPHSGPLWPSCSITGNEVINNYKDRKQFDTLISNMKGKLEDILTCNALIFKFNADLQQSVAAMENCQGKEVSQCVSHQAAGYQVMASEMTKACTSFMNLAESYSRKYSTLYHSEHEQRVKLEQIVKSLTQEKSKSWETVADEHANSDSFDSDKATNSSEKSCIDVTVQVYQAVASSPPPKNRRTRVPDRPNVSDSLWSVLKHCIGTDISKMPLPVSFAEPLSLLQRLTEDFEYAAVLDIASEITDPATQSAYVAAFIASAYSTTTSRTGKPFNPLLGETYECDRLNDLGWRSIAEQVSHHPPVAAMYGEGNNWEYWMDQSMKSKFKGTTLTVVPLGECHLKFKSGNRYCWRKPNTGIHNVIVGRLWVEQEGDVDIKCATSNVTCKLTFVSSGWTGENYLVKGVIKDGSGKPVFDIVGNYSTQIEYRPAGSKDPGTVVWKRTEPPADSSKYYNFTVLACQLNEMETGVAPTDSRNRPDQRLMEEGSFDEANVMKKKLEDFQRANKKDTWKPSWFKLQADPDTKTEMWTYGKEYWPSKAKKDWSRCPSHIFSPP